MAVIIYGLRDYGRVTAHGGEYAQTRFFHIWFAPLVPTGSSWVTGPRADGTNAHGIKLHARSVAAGYLRVWGPLLAVGSLSAGIQGGHVAALIATVIATALTFWSWSWRTLRGAAAVRRSDFNLIAFGTRCEPSRMLDSQRVIAKRDLDRRWADRSPSRSPNEVATHGTSDATEAVLAYGLLRLSSIERGRAGASDGADADRILAGRHDAPQTGDGPYRASVAGSAAVASGAGLAQLVEQRTAETAPFAARYAEDPAVALRRQRRRSRLQAFGLVVLTMAAFGGVVGFVMSLRSTLPITIVELSSVHPPMHRPVSVTCDAIDPPLWEATDRHGDITTQIAMCHVGKKLLPVKFSGGAIGGPVVTGRLHEITDKLAWYSEGVRSEPQIEMRTFEHYLDATRSGADVGAGVFGLLIALVTPVLWVLWYRARRRRKTAQRAMTAAAISW